MVPPTILQSITSAFVNNKRKLYVYCAFVDYQNTFEFVVRDILWEPDYSKSTRNEYSDRNVKTHSRRAQIQNKSGYFVSSFNYK